MKLKPCKSKVSKYQTICTFIVILQFKKVCLFPLYPLISEAIFTIYLIKNYLLMKLNVPKSVFSVARCPRET